MQFLAQVWAFTAGTTTLVISTPSIPQRTLVVISITTATRWTGKTAPPLKTKGPATTMLHPFLGPCDSISSRKLGGKTVRAGVRPDSHARGHQLRC